ncbi:MAG: hypothetical protein LC792_09115 [Actinobacteria bacterium]|nr:hypothetical protein [Actinomycetota bacterium]
MRAAAVAVALGLATLVAGPGVAQAAPPAGTTVSDVVVGFTFVVGYAALNAPDQAVRLHPGDTVEWTNLDPTASPSRPCPRCCTSRSRATRRR